MTHGQHNYWKWVKNVLSGGSMVETILLRLYSATGNMWIYGDCSAQSFTDRTPYPKDRAEAYDAVKSLIGKNGKVQHEKMHKSIKSGEGKRDLSALVSAQNEVIKDLIARIEELEARSAK